MDNIQRMAKVGCLVMTLMLKGVSSAHTTESQVGAVLEVQEKKAERYVVTSA